MKKEMISTAIVGLILLTTGCANAASAQTKNYGGAKVTPGDYAAYTSYVTAMNTVNKYILGKSSQAQAIKAVKDLRGKVGKTDNAKAEIKEMKHDLKDAQSELKHEGNSIDGASEVGIDLQQVASDILPGKPAAYGKKAIKISDKMTATTQKYETAANKQTTTQAKTNASSLTSSMNSMQSSLDK